MPVLGTGKKCETKLAPRIGYQGWDAMLEKTWMTKSCARSLEVMVHGSG